MTNTEQLTEALADLEALDSPRRRVETITFSVCVPRSLAEAFRNICAEHNESHPAVVRRMMADHVARELARKENGSI